MSSPNRSFLRYSLLLLLVTVILIFTRESTHSFSALMIAFRQSAILGLLCIGLSLVVFTGEVDFSIGAILALGSGICSGILVHYPNAVLPAVACALLACILCGLLNGIIVSLFRLPAATVTFVQMFVYSGISTLFSNGISDRLVSPVFYRVFNGMVLGLPTGALTWACLLALVSLTLHYTYWGQYLYAIGGNEQALRNIGVNTALYKILAFSCCGFFSGLAGVFMLARLSVSTGSTNVDLVFEALTVIALGGIGFSNFRGRFLGLFLGTITLAMLKICMTVYALSTGVQNLIVAMFFIFSLLLRTHSSWKSKSN